MSAVGQVVSIRSPPCAPLTISPFDENGLLLGNSFHEVCNHTPSVSDSIDNGGADAASAKGGEVIASAQHAQPFKSRRRVSM